MAEARSSLIDRVDVLDPRGGRAVPVWLHRPAGLAADARVVIVMHGMSRNAEAYLEAWVPEAERRGFVVAAPEFDARSYPTAREYNEGDVLTEAGALRPRAEWLFPVVDRIFERVREAAGLAAESYCLYGHSAGAQLVHRLVTLAWSPRIELAISANAGAYCMPRLDVAYPFGLGGTGFEQSDLPALLARPLVVLLGSGDTDPAHPALPRHPAALEQGEHRYARGQAYLAAGREAARALGVECRWRLEIAPGVGHVHAAMAPFAARLCGEPRGG